MTSTSPDRMRKSPWPALALAMMSTPASISWPSKRRRSSPCCDLVKGTNSGEVCKRFLMRRSREKRSSASRTEGTAAMTWSRAVFADLDDVGLAHHGHRGRARLPGDESHLAEQVFSNKRATSLGPRGVSTKTRSSPLATRKSESPASPCRMTKSPSLSRRIMSERATAMNDSCVSSDRNGSGWYCSW